MRRTKTKDTNNLIWRFLRSVKLAIALLIILAILSILGTLIPQREEAVGFASNMGPELFRLFMTLSLFDVYHSFWFRFIIGCLGLNLIVCSLDRFPKTLSRFNTLPSPDRSRPFENLPSEQSFEVRQDLTDTAAGVKRFILSRYGRVREKKGPGQVFLYGEKGRYSHFGLYLVHLSVLLFLTGGMIGSILGFEAFVNIGEGDQVDSLILRKSRASMSLGFDIRLDKFLVDFYENGAPKEYRSDLSFLVKGKEVEKRSVLVNHPVQFRGLTFYQSSYGTIAGNKVILKISAPKDKQETDRIEVEAGKPISLPGNAGRFVVEDIRTDFMKMGPAILISIQTDQGKKSRFWVFQRYEIINKRFPGLLKSSPKLNPSAFKPFTFILEDLETRYYTGLQVNRDPGVPFIWAGCFLIVAGFVVTFFTSHRRVWVHLSKSDNGSMIRVAGTASKNKVGLQSELERMTHRLRTLLNEKA